MRDICSLRISDITFSSLSIIYYLNTAKIHELWYGTIVWGHRMMHYSRRQNISHMSVDDVARWYANWLSSYNIPWSKSYGHHRLSYIWQSTQLTQCHTSPVVSQLPISSVDLKARHSYFYLLFSAQWWTFWGAPTSPQDAKETDFKWRCCWYHCSIQCGSHFERYFKWDRSLPP